MALFGGKNKLRQWVIISLILLLVSAQLTYVFYSGFKDPDVLLDEHGIKIEGGGYSVESGYAGIAKCDTVSVLPEIYLRTNGFAASGVLKGHFKMKGIEDAMLFVDDESTPFIYLEFEKNKIVFINFEDRGKTLDLFSKIESKLRK